MGPKHLVSSANPSQGTQASCPSLQLPLKRPKCIPQEIRVSGPAPKRDSAVPPRDHPSPPRPPPRATQVCCLLLSPQSPAQPLRVPSERMGAGRRLAQCPAPSLCPTRDLGGHYMPPGRPQPRAGPGPPRLPRAPFPPHRPQAPSAVLTPARPRGHCACACGGASWAGRTAADALLVGGSPARGGNKEGTRH